MQEGCMGGGNGMICHEFKSGIGTSSRVLSAEEGGWTVGALVQANYGVRSALRVTRLAAYCNTRLRLMTGRLMSAYLAWVLS
ncbi:MULTISPECIES: P1 family peptidase [Pseudomonas]|uniref:P1 family peptidase n=1 Tax=Pseudomonas TaxID=286 RepID=UPI00209A6CF2|nr:MULTISPECIES: P1 family peptidase [Pseudomonas]